MQAWWGVLLIAIGGAVGAVARHGSNELCQRWLLPKLGRAYPLSSLLVNVVGCLLMGALMALVRRGQLSEEWRLLLITGFLGALTTFSAFSFETLMLTREDAFGLATVNTLANVVLSFLAAWLGWRLCQGG